MKESTVNFYSEGETIAGILRLPDTGDGPYRGIVQGPGWMGLKDANLYLRYHEALTAAGFAVLIFDYRGFGDSGGRTDILLPSMQLEDLINAVTYLASRDDIDSDNIGTFGSGGHGRRECDPPCGNRFEGGLRCCAGSRCRRRGLVASHEKRTRVADVP